LTSFLDWSRFQLDLGKIFAVVLLTQQHNPQPRGLAYGPDILKPHFSYEEEWSFLIGTRTDEQNYPGHRFWFQEYPHSAGWQSKGYLEKGEEPLPGRGKAEKGKR